MLKNRLYCTLVYAVIYVVIRLHIIIYNMLFHTKLNIAWSIN